MLMNFFRKLMYGRYGSDQLSFFLLILYVILILLSGGLRRVGKYGRRMLAAILLPVLFLTGCGGQELEDRSLVTSVCVDPGQEGTYRLTFGFGAAEDNPVEPFETEAGSLREAKEVYDEKYQKNMDFNHLKNFYFSEEILYLEAFPKLLEELLLATTRQEIDVFSGDALADSPLAKHPRLRLFAWEQAALDLKVVLDDLLLARAKAINLRYSHLYAGVAETAENREAEWAKLDAFTRESNISAADYHLVRLDMLAAMGLPASAEKLPPETMELLAELEHIRWCRYHYLNNWTFGQPEDGRRKDPSRRVHRDLIPYRDLTEADREKDRENIRILLSVEGSAL